MAMLFNELLKSANINPSDVRLLRHKDNRSIKGKNPYNLWKNNRTQFEVYHSIQDFSRRKSLDSKYWATFLGTPDGETMFIGLYAVEHRGLLDEDTPRPHMGGIDKAGTVDKYELALVAGLDEYIGKLYIEWGNGYLAWVQRADKQDKVVTRIEVL